MCNPRKIALPNDGSKSDRIDARKLAEQLYTNRIKSVYHGEHGLRTMKELARSYARFLSCMQFCVRMWKSSLGFKPSVISNFDTPVCENTHVPLPLGDTL